MKKERETLISAFFFFEIQSRLTSKREEKEKQPHMYIFI
jgi:hypothetical protein